jgi:hypothetical protein
VAYRKCLIYWSELTTCANREHINEWIEAGTMDALEQIVKETYDRLIGLEFSDIAVDCCITKAPCGGERAGRSPVDRLFASFGATGEDMIYKTGHETNVEVAYEPAAQSSGSPARRHLHRR